MISPTALLRLKKSIAMLLLTIGMADQGAADVIRLKNGKRLTAERVWEKDGKLWYEKEGNLFGFSKELVLEVLPTAYIPDARDIMTKHVESTRKLVQVDVLDETLETANANDSEVVRDEQVDKAKLREIERECRTSPVGSPARKRYLSALKDAIQCYVRNREFGAASALMEPCLQLDPDDLQTNLIFGWLQLKQGNFQQAQDILMKAQIHNSGSADLQYLLGLAFYLQDKNELAVRALRQSLQLGFRAEVEQLLKKIEQENQAESTFQQANSLHFVVRYEGSPVNHSLSQGILASLERSFAELESELGQSPKQPIAVVLYSDEVFRDVTQTPDWVGALNDGKIRLPTKGLSSISNTVRRILKHELTHSFIRLTALGNCPVWLNEGLAQHLSGDSSQNFVLSAKQAITQRRFPPLKDLEAPFLALPTDQAAWAYQESLLAAEFLITRFGLRDVQRLLAQAGLLGDFVAALESAFRLDYPGLQTEFEGYLRER